MALEKCEPPLPQGVWSRLGRSLAKTRRRIAAGVGDLLLGERAVDDAVLEELETSLLLADVGVDATERVMEALAARVSRRELANAAALHAALGRELVALLEPAAAPFVVGEQRPWVVLAVGVNGAGKTTSIGKLAHLLRGAGHSVLLAAGDTYRAAAIEQLSAWGTRNGVPVIAQKRGSDAASVIHDAIAAAKARGLDVVLADTAGRLQAKAGLMDELRKIKRVAGRAAAGAPHEVLLVLDAGVGQNALSQVAEFDRAAGVTGLAVTKLDGTAKAGVIVALATQTGLPVRFVGVGESAACAALTGMAVPPLRTATGSHLVRANADDSRDRHLSSRPGEPSPSRRRTGARRSGNRDLCEFPHSPSRTRKPSARRHTGRICR